MALGTGDRRGLNTGWRVCQMEAKEKMSGATGKRICCWSATRCGSQRDPAPTMQQRGFIRWWRHSARAEEYELKVDKAPANVDSALTRARNGTRTRANVPEHG